MYHLQTNGNCAIKHDPVYFSSDGDEMNQAEETEDSQEGDVQVWNLRWLTVFDKMFKGKG